MNGLLTKSIAPFDLILPSRIRFGRGVLPDSVGDIASFGPRIILVRGSSPARAAPLVDALGAAGIALHQEICAREPDLDMLIAALRQSRAFAPDAVLAIGGGAAIDLGKALAALLPAPNPDPLEHLEVVGRGQPLHADPLPFIAVPTTAGTGSEATRNAVIGVPEARRKVSLRDPRMMARLAIIDPALTDGTPADVTFASGLDAVTQVIEPYLSRRASPVTDALCRDAIPRGLAALGALAKGESPDARDNLALVSHLSGVALANAGLGAVHGIAGVLGGDTGAAHGMICGQLLPPVLNALRAAAPSGDQLSDRLNDIEAWCQSGLGCGIAGLADWSHANGLPKPATPLSAQKAREIAEKSQASSSMKPSPIAFGPDQLIAILTEGGWHVPGS